MKAARYILFILLFGVCGYLRERFFEHMNIILAGVYRGTDEYANVRQQPPGIMQPMLHWSYAQLYYSKYLFTILWVLVFWGLGVLAIKKLSPARHLLRYLNLGYVIIIAGAALSLAIGYLVNKNLLNDEYTLSRWLLGIAQSPLICLILLASEKLYIKSNTHDT